MSYRSVLIHVRPDPGTEGLIRTAVAFAQDHQAHLTGLAAQPSIFAESPGMEYLDSSAVQEIVDQETAELAAAEKRFSALACGLGERAHWRARRNFPNTAMAEEAAGADIVLADGVRDVPGYGLDTPTLVCEIGLPVLVVPPGTETLHARSVLIAWRNTREARRAVSAALPLLKTARTVHLLQAGPETDEARDAVRAAADRLSRHGVNATAKVRRCAGSAADDLRAYAGDIGADLMVLGAYGHSRAREWVLGGVTHNLLENPPLPLLLAH